jgi:hypothetical protein
MGGIGIVGFCNAIALIATVGSASRIRERLLAHVLG